MITLDANLPDQVGSPRVIEINLAEPNRKMMILSGIAIPGWHINDDERTYREDVVVNLRRTVLSVEQATVSVGLASIGNDETTFLFATDSAGLDVDPNSQELLLNVALALRGESTGLDRFGYQVVTVVTTQTAGISGTISWRKSIFDASKLTRGQVAQMFKIAANRVQRINTPGGFEYDQFTPLAFGVTTGLTSNKDTFKLAYEIPGAPYNQPLIVTAAIDKWFRASKGRSFVGRSGGPDPVVLTISKPSITGVDFEVVTVAGPH